MTNNTHPPPVEYRVGDVVHARATIISGPHELGGAVTLRYDQADWTSCVPVASIVHVEPAPLKVGDEVTPAWDVRGCWICKIEAINDGVAWLWRFGKPAGNVKLDELRRAGTPAP